MTKNTSKVAGTESRRNRALVGWLLNTRAMRVAPGVFIGCVCALIALVYFGRAKDQVEVVHAFHPAAEIVEDVLRSLPQGTQLTTARRMYCEHSTSTNSQCYIVVRVVTWAGSPEQLKLSIAPLLIAAVTQVRRSTTDNNARYLRRLSHVKVQWNDDMWTFVELPIERT